MTQTLEEAIDSLLWFCTIVKKPSKLEESIMIVINKVDELYSEEEIIGFSEWVSLNFPQQHDYLRNLQKRSLGIDVPVEKFQGYRTTKELFEQYKKQ